MTQTATTYSDKTYLERVMRRLIPVMIVFVSTLALIFTLTATYNANRLLSTEHSQGISRISDLIANDINLYAENNLTLARDPNIIQFMTGRSLNINQATSRASDLIVLHSSEYFAIHYVDENGFNRVDINNRNGIAEPALLPEGGTINPYAQTLAFQRAMASAEITAFIGNFRLVANDTIGSTVVMFDIFTPIIPDPQSSPVGVIHMEVMANKMLTPDTVSTGSRICHQQPFGSSGYLAG